ncbi:MAG: hypothetical protein KF798_07425 [Candidatus Paracaedibacteraceae bacterium]|nr:hypothetical protein [Candidatus Paracaedibacteraceae bacterium]
MRHYGFLLCLVVAGCSSPADISDMVYTIPEKKRATSASKYYNNVVVEKVTGGEETEFYNDAKIDNDSFKQAIEESLKTGNLLSEDGKGAYHLTVDIAKFDQQSFGEKPKTEIHVKFTLLNTKTKVNVFSEVYDDDAFATNKDAWRRGAKVEIATERAAKGVIHKLTDRLLM